MTMSRIGAGLGTAAFVLGLSVVGPQGAATADSGEEGSPAVGSTQSAAGQKAPAHRTARNADRVADRRQSAAPDSDPGPSATVPSAAGRRGTAALPAATAGTAARVNQSTATVPATTPVTTLATTTTLPAAASRRDPAEVVAAAPVAAQIESVADAGQAQPAELTMVTSTPPQAARANPLVELNAAVIGWFDDASSLLGTLPATPVSEFLQGALLLVRRTLFNQKPTVEPVNYLVGPFGDTTGTIGAVDPEGDALTYSLSQQPLYGTVEIAADGTYTYTPGSDFKGYDSFRVTVSDRGFNLLDPVQSRSAEAFVEVPNWSRGGPTSNFYIYNFTGQNLLVRSVSHDPSVSNPVEPKPGLIVHPGDTVRVEIASALYSSLDPTRVSFAVPGPGGQSWDVVLKPDLLGLTARASCAQGYCTYPSVASNLTTSILLVDAPGTVWDYSKDSVQGQQILNSLLKASQSLPENTVNLSYADAVIGAKKYVESDYSPTNTSATNPSGNETFKYSVQASSTYTTTTSSNWEVEASITPTILKVVDIAVAGKYGQGTEISESRTFTTTRDFNAIPYSYNTVFAAAPQINVSGDLKATFGACTISACTSADPNVTFVFRDVDYTYPDPTPAENGVLFYSYTRPYQDASGGGFYIKDARTWTSDPTFPLSPTYQVGEQHQSYARAYVGATVAGSEDFTDRAVLTSSDESVATIDSTGLITALSPGTTTITATYAWAIPRDQSGQVQATMRVTVVPAAV